MLYLLLILYFDIGLNSAYCLDAIGKQLKSLFLKDNVMHLIVDVLLLCIGTDVTNAVLCSVLRPTLLSCCQVLM